jgi:hypothetical protein
VIVRGTWTPEDRAESIYRYLPFEVPSGCPAVSVRLDYERTAGVIDLGIFDPAAFRGWTGSARAGFVITPTDATPGYLPGEIAAGEWRVMLGLHRVPPEGIEYLVEVGLEESSPEPMPEPPGPAHRPPRRELPASDGRRWLAGDLHSHTVHSDGVLTVPQLANLARSSGLDFLAVTDHNSPSHHPLLPGAARRYGVLLLAGQEVTTDEGHANCLGEVGWVDFRRPADDWLRAAQSAGGLMSINHPLDRECSWRRPMEKRAQLVETWHKTWDRRSDEPLAWWERHGGVPVGGSDFHSPAADRLGAPTTWVEAEGDDVLGALRAGRVALSTDPWGPLLVGHEGELVAIDAEGTTWWGPGGERRSITGDRAVLPGGEGLHRLVAREGRVVALTADGSTGRS